jgi:hypothetical protein
MSHLLRPPSEKTFRAADALNNTPRCILLLEAGLVDLLTHPLDEKRRTHARDLARTLSAGCPQCGFHASSRTLRKIEALLRIPPKDAPELQARIADKLLDLVALLKDEALAKVGR